MKFGPSRGNPLIIFENFFKNFGLLLLAIGVAFIKGPEVLFSNVALIALVVFSPIKALSKYLFTKYSIDDEKMIINSGLFVKKTMEIPLKVITTVDLSQSLLFQLFNVYKIKADNSSQTNENAKQAEIVFALKKEQALYVKSLLESETQVDYETSSVDAFNTNITPVIACSLIDFIKLGALQSKLLYFITIVSTVCGGGGYLFTFISKEINVDRMFENYLKIVTPVFGIILLILAAYLMSILSSMVVTAIRYFNYTVTNQKDALLVKYGLFTKKSYTLMKEKISGVSIKQSPLMRILGYCTVDVFIIGYGDKSENNEQELSLLYPIAKLDQVNNVLEQLLPDMTFQREYHKRTKGSLRYFFYCFRLFFVLGIIAGFTITALLIEKNIPNIAIYGFVVASLFLLLLVVISIYMEYYNSGIYSNHKVVSLCKGSFSLNMIFIKAEKLESITEHSAFWKRKNGFTNIKLGFLAPLRVANMTARNITFEDYNEIQKVMNY